MCSRFTQTTPVDLMAQLFGIRNRPNLLRRYNIAPTQEISVIRDSGGVRQLAAVRWGLIPEWAREMGKSPLINARSETVTEKPSFRSALAARRCIVPCNGYYEWIDGDPHFIYFADKSPMFFAGLWESWRDNAGKVIESCAIITTAASPDMTAVHARMPAILSPREWEQWLDNRHCTAQEAADMLRHWSGDRIDHHPVGPVMRNTANDNEECIARWTKEAPRQGSLL